MLTLTLAVVGAVTGMLSLAWQVLNYRLTGGRVELLCLRYPAGDGTLRIQTSISNVGRLDITVVGYGIWEDVPGYLLRRAIWRVQLMARLGRHVAVRTLLTFPPSLWIAESAGPMNESGDSLEFPVIIRAGGILKLPEMQFQTHFDDEREQKRRRTTVAIQLGSGRHVTARVIDFGTLKPPELPAPTHRGPWWPGNWLQ